jgi:hypothetical protein
MIDKRAMTRKFLKELGLETSTKNVRKHHAMWWMNPRSRDNESGLRLTDAGFLMMTEKLDVKSYSVKYPPEMQWSSRLILDMDKYLNCPYYLEQKGIVVFREKMAVELILYEGNLQRYVTAKIMSQKYNT